VIHSRSLDLISGLYRFLLNSDHQIAQKPFTETTAMWQALSGLRLRLKGNVPMDRLLSSEATGVN
jgi:hypothetical protein